MDLRMLTLAGGFKWAIRYGSQIDSRKYCGSDKW